MHPKLTFAVRAKEVPVAEGEYPWITADDNAVWAEPDLTHAAQQMRAARLAAKDAEFSENVKAFAKEHFDSGRIGKMMSNRITQLIADYRSDKPKFIRPELLAK